MKNKDVDKISMFKSKFLESLTRTTPKVALPYYTLLSVALAFVNFYFGFLTVTWFIIHALIGFVSWTFIEYLVHRYVFHITSKHNLITKFQFFIHGVHHQEPHDDQRLIMPPLPGTFIIVIFYFILELLMGNVVFTFLSGMLIGYQLYVTVHFMLHTKNPPKFLKKQLVHHALHHYKYPDKAFGVSSPLWDIIFRTMPPMEKHQGKKLKK